MPLKDYLISVKANYDITHSVYNASYFNQSIESLISLFEASSDIPLNTEAQQIIERFLSDIYSAIYNVYNITHQNIDELDSIISKAFGIHTKQINIYFADHVIYKDLSVSLRDIEYHFNNILNQHRLCIYIESLYGSDIDNIMESLPLFKSSIEEANSLHILNNIKIWLLGKKSLVSNIFSAMRNLNASDKATLASKANLFKDQLSKYIDTKRDTLEREDAILKMKLSAQDVTLPHTPINFGLLHPITITHNAISEFFAGQGFVAKEGPHIESSWNNFDALNIGKDHPARDDHDTFYLKDSESLLRTHTSTIQIRALTDSHLPIKAFSIGSAFRSDYDVTHTPMFHQVECFCVSENASIADLQLMVERFCKYILGTEVALRFRPSYFPFTTPSFEVDIMFQEGSWLEVLGAGMIHPKVLENCNIDPSKFTGFAFGAGVERLTMLKYNISDLRAMYSGANAWIERHSMPWYKN